jgi:hypothetical protein
MNEFLQPARNVRQLTPRANASAGRIGANCPNRLESLFVLDKTDKTKPLAPQRVTTNPQKGAWTNPKKSPSARGFCHQSARTSPTKLDQDTDPLHDLFLAPVEAIPHRMLKSTPSFSSIRRSLNARSSPGVDPAQQIQQPHHPA